MTDAAFPVSGGPGIWQGLARVIHKDGDLNRFRQGEILVCDAVDPNITFVVPLAAGIVERRGGMLIHGAIIAREASRVSPGLPTPPP